MACLLAGLIAAVGLLSSIPLYTDAVQNRLLEGELTESGHTRPPFAFLWRYIGAWNGNISWEEYQPINTYLTEQSATVINLPFDPKRQTYPDPTIRHVATAKLRLFPASGSSFSENRLLMWSSIGFVTSLESQIQIVEGRYPSPEADSVEVIVSQAIVDRLGLQINESYQLITSEFSLPLRVVGVWKAQDRAASFWFYQPDAFEEMLLTSEAQFISGVVPLVENPVGTAVWYQIYDGGRIRPNNVNHLLENVQIIEARATALLNGTNLDASPIAALQTYDRSNSLLILTLTIFSVPLVVILLYFINLIANMVVQRSQSEIAILRSRGMKQRQIMLLYLIEGLLIGGFGLGIGLWFGGQIAQLMGRTRTFLDPAILSGSELALLTPVLSQTAVYYGFLGVGLALISLLFSAKRVSRHTIVSMRLQQARFLLPPVWQRYFLDFLLLIPSFYGWYQLEQYGRISLLGDGNDPFSNPLLFLVPILFCFSLALVAIRFFPVLMSILAWIAENLPSTTFLLTSRQLARATTQYSGPLLLLSLTVSLATFTASMAVTFDDHLAEKIYYQTGADLNLAELGENTAQDTLQGDSISSQLSNQPQSPNTQDEDEPRWLFLPVTDHLLVDGVEAATRVGEYTAVSSIGDRQQTGRIMGVDRIDFSQAAYYRSYFAANESLGGLMNRLAVQPDHVLVSRNFMIRNSLIVGDPLRLTIGVSDEFADAEFVIAGLLDLFPTQYPQDGPFFVANLDYLHDSLGGVFPYNVWLRTDPTISTEQIVNDVRSLGFAVITSQDARQKILEEQTRPERQGLFGLLSVGFLGASMLTVLGFLVYAAVSFNRRSIYLGMLRAVGLSVGQMAAYLAGEQAVLILAGVSLGTGLGVWASHLFIPFLQVGSSKTAVIPPFVVKIAWQQLNTICILFGMMFVIAVLILILLVARMRLFEAVKLGETV
jgi:putative ABC transport system permease protein